jgi:hypothetical protein
MEVGKNILEVTEEKRLRWFGHVKNARKQTATESLRMGTRGNAKKGKTQRAMDRWSKTEHDKPWTDRRGYQRQRQMAKQFWVKENHCRVDKR